jgi:hypothetical protein
LDRRLGGPHSRSGRGEEKNSQPPPRIEPPITQRYTTEISQLSTFHHMRNSTIIIKGDLRNMLLEAVVAYD